MRLHESRWTDGGGLTPEWRWVAGRRVTDTLKRLRAVSRAVGKDAPAVLRKRRYGAGIRFFLAQKGPLRDRLAVHPAMDYWLFLWDRHFSQPCSPSDWDLQLGLFQGFAVTLALERGATLELDSLLDPDARLCLYGSPFSFDYPKALAGKPVRLSARAGRLKVAGPGALQVELSLEELKTLPEGGLQLGAVRAGRSPEAAPGLVVEDQAWLLMHGVSMHGLARLGAPEKARFIVVLQAALKDLAEKNPTLLAEMGDMVRLYVPLENPMKYGSVSSSYVNLRGAICLSHAEDPVLQAETLIHEFCHQKMNQLMIVEPLLLPGQAGQVFYSPWRKDARRLRGLLLGAHAFLNVARYLLKSVSRDSYRREEGIDAMLNVAARLFQVEDALRSLAFYGSATEFGRRFQLRMWQDLGGLFHAVQWFPPALIEEARTNHLKHRAEHALADTGFHKLAGFVDNVARAPFLTPGGLLRPAAAAVIEGKAP